MKIKEVEKLTGITAKNIRFYEEQGLLSPERDRVNSYRDYDERDVRIVKTIKALRKLDMPIDAIREVLTGVQPLDVAVAKHTEYLEGSIRALEAAKLVCHELAAQRPRIETFDVDGCLNRIDSLEQEGSSFANILDDFMTIARAVEKLRFTIFPCTLVLTPRQFTDTLLEYAAGQKLDITITKECMYPEFVMDGIEYSASVISSGRAGHIIRVVAKNAEAVLPQDMQRGKRDRMVKFYRYGIPILFWIGIAVLIMSSRF